MKIAHVLNRLPPPSGYHEFILANEQARDGHDVLILASDRAPQGWRGPGATEADFADLPFDVKRLPGLGVHPFLWIPALGSELRAFEPDVAHVHGVVHHWGLWTVARLKRQGLIRRIVVDSHAASYNTKRMGTAGDLLRGLMLRAATAGPMRDVDALIGVSPESASFIERYGMRVTDIIALPAVMPARVATPRADPDTVRIFYGGKVEPARDLDILVRAAVRAADCVGERRLVLTLCGAGDPAFVSSLLELAADSRLDCRHTGHLPRDAYYDELTSSDIAVWPGQVTISIQEALSVGVPVVAADVPDIRFLAQLCGGIQLCSRGDVEDLATKLAELSVNGPARLMLAAQAGACAQAHLTPAAHWSRFRQFYLA